MKKIKLVIIFLIVFVLLFFCVKLIYSVEAFSKETTKARKKDVVLKINKYPLNIDEILYSNTKDFLEEELLSEEMDLEYSTIYKENDELPSGTIHITQMGVIGKQNTILRKKYKNNELYDEDVVANNIKRASIDKVVEIGTGKGKNNYKIEEDDTLYVTPSALKVMEFPSIDSEMLCTLIQGNEVQVKEICDDSWCYVTSSDTKGYVLIEALSNINPLRDESGSYEYDIDEYTKSELLEKLDINMDISVPSGLSIEQFRKVLQYNERDKNNIFTENADYFYYAEQEYGINGVFLAAIAIHESGYGTSNIAVNKNNLFGYMAYDSSPYVSAKTFSTYGEGIDLVARVLIKYYLNEKGTSIYGGEYADGRYYSGKTIKSVNKFYASDLGWANGVYSQMKVIYEAL